MTTETWNDEEDWTRVEGAGAWLLGVEPISPGFVPLATGGSVPRVLRLFLRVDDRPGLRISLRIEIVEGEVRITGLTQDAPIDPSGPSDSWALADLRAKDFVRVKPAWLEAAKEYVAAAGKTFLAPGAGPETLGRRRRRGPSGPTAQQVAEVVALREQGLSFKEISDQLPVSKATAARWFRLGVGDTQEESSQ